MTSLKRFIAIFFIVLVSAACSSINQQQAGAKEVEIPALIQQQNFIFNAQSLTPQGGTMQPLTAEYDVTVSKDSINSFLPYMGRSFTAPMDPRDIGVNFISTNFDYQQRTRSNGNWEIVITPRDAKEIRQMTMNISPNGYASVIVTLTNKQSISYNGIIVKKADR